MAAPAARVNAFLVAQLVLAMISHFWYTPEAKLGAVIGPGIKN